MNSLDFSQEELARAASYHRPRYLSLVADLILSGAVLVILQWVWLGPWHLVDGLGWAGSAALYVVLVDLALLLFLLPTSFWRGYVQEQRFGFSTQSPAGWAIDLLKSETVAVILLAAFWVGLVGLARWLPSAWPAVAAAVVAAFVFLLSFVAPVVLEPLFNRFRSLDDARLAAELRAVAERAGVPVRDVLVADASRRTTKVNAYVSGIGATRRVVLYDTLLDSADEGQLKLVLAHELGHRRERHVARLTAALMVIGVACVVIVWAIFGTLIASPRELPAVLLVLFGLRLAVAPVAMWASRRYERVADRFSLELTHDLPAYERAHLNLARANLGDLAPPRLAYWFLFSHPTTPERLALGRAWAGA